MEVGGRHKHQPLELESLDEKENSLQQVNFSAFPDLAATVSFFTLAVCDKSLHTH
jgi:hypothetical protein